MNAQVQPSIQENRRALCSQLIEAGVTNPEDIVHTAQAIEKFIYGESEKTPKTVESKAEKMKAEIPAAEKEIITKTEEVSEQPKIEIADIKTALMRVAKANRDAFQAIMDQFGAANITQINADDYPAVITAVEKYETENAQ